MSLYHRLGHMKDTPLVKLGQWVKRGDIIGYVGSTGASTGPHCHYDIANIKPVSFTAYVYGMSYNRVRSIYIDPAPYVKNMIPINANLPMVGFHYLQGVRDPSKGIYFHPGMDLNGINDMGAPVHSPCEGRVVCVMGTSWIKNWLGRLVPSAWNSGWGNCVVIEMSPTFDISKVN